MIANLITQGSGAYRILSRFPPHLVLALPIRENPALANAALVEMCLHEIKMAYPRITAISATYEQTHENGTVLQIIVR